MGFGSGGGFTSGEGNVSGDQEIGGNLTVKGNATLGDASGDSVTINAGTTSGSALTMTSLAGTSLALQDGGITNAGSVSGSALTMTSLAGTSLGLQGGAVTSAEWNGTAIDNAYLSNSSVTVTAGDGLSGGGAVSLGGTVSLAVGVDDSSIETSGDALQVKALGVTNGMLGGSIANAKLSNSSITFGSTAANLGDTVSEMTLTTVNATTLSASVGISGSTLTLNNDQLTSTIAELNYCDGVSSAIQTQLDGKSPTTGHASIATVGTVTAGTWNATAVADAYVASAATWNAKQTAGDVLDDLNTLGASTADGEFLVATGAGALAWESGATARTSLGVDPIGTDNSTNVTLVTTSHDYLSIAGQAVTLGQIDISDDTNLAGGTGLTLTGDTLSVDASQTQITAVGTIATGVWNATAVAATKLDVVGATQLGTTLVQVDDLLVYDSANTTNKRVSFSNLEDSVFGNVSGDATVAAGGALTLAASNTNLTTLSNVTSVGTLTGLTVNGAVIGTPETVSGDGVGQDAVSTATLVTLLDTSAGTSSLTLAAGTSGQIKIITMATAGNAATMTAADGNLNVSTSIVWDAAGESVTLCYDGTKWNVVGNYGVTIS